jgi:hypothetical protein
LEDKWFFQRVLEEKLGFAVPRGLGRQIVFPKGLGNQKGSWKTNPLLMQAECLSTPTCSVHAFNVSQGIASSLMSSLRFHECFFVV